MSVWWTDRLTHKAPAVIIGSTVGVGCYQQLDGQFVSLPPASLPPSSSSLCAEEHKLSNTSTAAHVSSVLQLSAQCLHTEGSNELAGPTINTHTAQFKLPTGYCFSLSHTLHPGLCRQHSSFFFFPSFVIFLGGIFWFPSCSSLHVR